jgi:hypothetical protein
MKKTDNNYINNITKILISICCLELYLFLQCQSQASSKPTPAGGLGDIHYISDDSAYHFQATEGIEYVYYLPSNKARNDPSTRGTLNALVVYKGSDYFYPSLIGGISADFNGSIRGFDPDGSFNLANVKYDLISHTLNTYERTLTIKWKMRFNGDSCNYTYCFSVYGQTLTINITSDDTTKILGLGFGSGYSPTNSHRVVNVPCLPIANVLYDSKLQIFATLFTDWEKTNASGISPWFDAVPNNEFAYYSQKIFYEKKTNGYRNKLNETIYLSVSSDLNNVLPSIDGPRASYKDSLSSRMVISYFRPFPYLNPPFNNARPSYLDSLYKYDVRDAAFIIKNWNNGQFDHNYPDNIWPPDPFDATNNTCDQPGGGGITGLISLRQRLTSKGYLFGLHENYVDNHCMIRQNGKLPLPDGNDAKAFYFSDKDNCTPPSQSYLLKPSIAASVASDIQQQVIKNQLSSNSPQWCYLDVSSSINPSGPQVNKQIFGDASRSYVDFDESVSNAGKFITSVTAYRNLAISVRNNYGGPVQGEGGYHFLYAGYFDGLEGRLMTGNDNINGYQAPLLVDFAQKIRLKSAIHGVGHIADNFFKVQDTISHELVKIYIATELAYGHGGLITTSNIPSTDHSLNQAIIEQQHVLPVYKKIADQTPLYIEYYDGSIWQNASDYIKNHPGWDDISNTNFMSQVRVKYPNQITVIVNRHPSRTLNIQDLGNGNNWYSYNDASGIGTGKHSVIFNLPVENGWVVSDLSTNGDPDQPVLTYPADGAYNIPSSVELKWSVTPKATSYTVHIIKSSGNITEVVPTAWYALSSLTPGEVVQWYVTPSNTGGSGPQSATWSFTVVGKVSGTITYATTAANPIGNVNVTLTPATGTALTTTSFTTDGTYNFVNVPNGQYTLTAAKTNNWGGVDVADALAAVQYFIRTLTDLGTLGFEAGDVDKSGTINSTDALLIARRTLGTTTSFPAGDWVFTGAQSISVTNVNEPAYIRGRAVGDIDGSYTQTLPTGATFQKSFLVQLKSGTEKFTVSASTTASYGAVGMRIKVTSSKVVSITSKLPGFMSNIDDEGVSFGWFAADGITPVQFKANEAIVTVTLAEKTGDGSSVTVESKLVDIQRTVLNNNLSVSIQGNIPSVFELKQNYPNPFNPSTQIDYDLPMPGMVTLTVYNMLGQEVAKLVNEHKEAGSYTIQWMPRNLASGMYIYRIRVKTENETITTVKRLMLLK